MIECFHYLEWLVSDFKHAFDSLSYCVGECEGWGVFTFSHFRPYIVDFVYVFCVVRDLLRRGTFLKTFLALLWQGWPFRSKIKVKTGFFDTIGIRDLSIFLIKKVAFVNFGLELCRCGLEIAFGLKRPTFFRFIFSSKS